MEEFWMGVVVGLSVLLICLWGLHVGRDTKTEHQTNQLVIPSITITNVDGVVDTTYTYTFK